MNEIKLPLNIQTHMENGATLVVSISGGKDSDAMLSSLFTLADSRGWTQQMVLVHCDLGRAEWPQTKQYCEKQAKIYRLSYHRLERTDHDLIDGIWARWAKIQASSNPNRCPWPDARNRYCTSDWKRSVVDKWIRANYPSGQTVIVAMGLRAEESPSRAKKSVLEVRETANSPQKNRRVLNWLPIHHWTEQDVWVELGYSLKKITQWREAVQYWRMAGKPMSQIADDLQHTFHAHPAYALGNHRLSCAMCILADQNDLLNGATHNPDIYRELCRIEAVTGYSFRKGFWLSDLRPDLLPDETLSAVKEHKQ